MARFSRSGGSGAASWVVLICLVVGCSGGDAASLSGNVTFDGQPLSEGTIRFMPTSGTAGHGAGAKIVNGSYTVPKSGGLVAGSYTAMISSTREATAEEARKMSGDEEGRPDPNEDPSERDSAPKIQLLPAKYNLASTLTVTVEKGANTHDFNLER